MYLVHKLYLCLICCRWVELGDGVVRTTADTCDGVSTGQEFLPQVVASAHTLAQPQPELRPSHQLVLGLEECHPRTPA